MTTGLRQLPRGDIVVSGLVTAIALALLLLMPVVSRIGGGQNDGLDAELALGTPGPADWQWWLAVAAVLVQGALLTRISLAPGRVLMGVSAVAFLAALVPLGDASSIPLIAVIAASYSATRRRAQSASWLPLAVAVLLVAGAGALANLRVESGLMLPIGAAVGQAVAVVGIPAAVAAAVSARAQMRSSREREVAAMAGELEARTEAALSAERTAIARELHDIAAHHLSGIALMSSAISQQIDTDPAAAKAGLADVRSQTRTLLDELRGLVALLRQDDGASVNVESLAGLETLIPAARARGLDVSLTVAAGTTVSELSRGIGPLGQFAAYRTVQEALANAARHAPDAPCSVELGDAGGSLEIIVSNGPGPADAASRGGAADQGGFGLRGMEERAALTRSTLTYGHTEHGGWRVRLRVPRELGQGQGQGQGQGHGSTLPEGTRP